MSTQVHVLPDVESIVVAALKADATVAALVGGRISGELQAKSARPAITIAITGGSDPIDWWLTGPAVQVDVWGEKRQETREIALAANAALIAMGGNVQNLGVVTDVRTLITVRPMPDQNDARPRYSFEVRVVAHPLP
jgi:hypothetical protein